tara:strand:+ start:4284 stop:4523 length:240 start_codon:yes stop_codon:yes gene_type:complete
MATRTNKQLLEEVIQRLDVIDQRLTLFEQMINNLSPFSQPNSTNLPPPVFFSSEEKHEEFDSFMEFVNKFFDGKFGELG